jgi:ornithine cyclodeaminase/alanine dehydrogenase-like protein (mu-crystallin family)
MSLTILTARDVFQALPMRHCMDAMGHAMQALSEGAVDIPQRSILRLPGKPGVFGTMPGVGIDPEVIGCKVATIYPDNPGKGMLAIQGCVVMFDTETGAPAAILDGAAITALRTAAASGLATRLLANPMPRSHAVLGTGALASLHIDAIREARPSIDDILIWGRDTAKAAALAKTESLRIGMTVRAVTSVEEAAQSDIVSTVTAASEPILEGAWLRPGMHLNLVGAHSATAREADSQTIIHGSVWIDLLASALAEAGEILIPIAEGVYEATRLKGEIGQLQAGLLPGRSSAEEITIYKSVGVVTQDLFAARAACDNARAMGLGQIVPF